MTHKENDGQKKFGFIVSKKISKKKKVLPKLNKGRYGTGYAPGAWHGDHDSDGGGSAGGDAGAGGDGGGDGE